MAGSQITKAKKYVRYESEDILRLGEENAGFNANSRPSTKEILQKALGFR